MVFTIRIFACQETDFEHYRDKFKFLNPMVDTKLHLY